MVSKMNLEKVGQNEWNNSYMRGGNICFYPHEEIVRFVNKYVRKRDGIASFKNVMDISNEEWSDFKSLDLGCGIGRHVAFLDDFGLNPYGIDLSDEAIRIGKEWLIWQGKESISEHLVIGSVTELPFPDNYFEICVSHGVLDSMPRDIAKAGIKEAYRVLRKGGLMYLDLIMDTKRGDKDEVVKDGYEEGTVQSYFTIRTIYDFVGNPAEILEFKIIAWKDDNGCEHDKRAHLIIRKK